MRVGEVWLSRRPHKPESRKFESCTRYKSRHCRIPPYHQRGSWELEPVRTRCQQTAVECEWIQLPLQINLIVGNVMLGRLMWIHISERQDL